MEKNSRLISVDIIRVIAMLMVVYLHTIYGFTLRLDFFATKAWFVFEPFTALSNASITLFFMISGFLVINKNRSIIENCQMIIKRIVIPLTFFAVINAFYEVYKYKLSLFPGLLKQLPNFTHGWFWFLVVLLFLYSFNPLWQILFLKKENHKTALYLTGFFLLYTITTISLSFISNNRNFFNDFTSWLGFLFFYLYGAAIRNKLINVNRTKLNLFLITLGAVIKIAGDYFALSLQLNSVKSNLGSYLNDYLSLPVILIAMGIFNLLITQDEINLSKLFGNGALSILRKLADLSFGIYLVHFFIVNVFSDILQFNIDKLRINIYLYNITYFFTVLGISILIIWVIGKIPKLKIIIGGR